MKSKKFIENFKISCNYDTKVVLGFQNLVHNFSQFLVELRFSEIKMKSQQIIHYLILPKLKILKLKSVDENFCKMIFTNLSSLEVLKLEFVNFHKNFRNRLANQKNLKKIYFRECVFAAFEADVDEFEFEFLEFIEISFFQANSWKTVKNSLGISQFFDSSLFRAVKNLKISGIRGESLSKILRSLRNLENLEIFGFWASDISDMDITNQKLNLYVPNFAHLDDFPWRKGFRGLQTILASSIEEKSENSQADRDFKKFLRASASKMIQNKIYKIDNSPMDPLTKLPEDIHEFIFQHLNGRDALNSMEVSQNWKFYFSQARNVMSKIQLKLYDPMKTEDERTIHESVQRFQTVLCYSSRLPFMVNFCRFVKKITIIGDAFDGRGEKLEFPNLEVLKIKRDPTRYFRVGSLLEVFKECRKLKVRILENLYFIQE